MSGGKKDTRSRQERRRDTGEDFTPLPLVNEILDHLPEGVWSDPDKVFLDPSCGSGNFLVEIKARLIAAGHSEENVLSRVLGIDLMHDNVVEACERLGVMHNPEAPFAVSRTVVCANTLEHKGKISELFDIAEEEFHPEVIDPYFVFKEVLLGIGPILKKAPAGAAKDRAVAAWKLGRDLIKAAKL